MPAGKSDFKNALQSLFESPKSSEAESIDALADAITNYLMTTVIVGASPSTATKPKILQEAKKGLAGLNTPGAAPGKLGAAIVLAAVPITTDPEIIAVAAAALGPELPEFNLPLGLTPSEAATAIADEADTKIKSWSATNSASGATVKWI